MWNFSESYTTQKTSCAKLSCQADQLPDRIDKLSLNLRGATKTIKNLWREIAINDAAQLKKSDEKLLKIHRKEAENDYLITFVNELKDQVDVSLLRIHKIKHFAYERNFRMHETLRIKHVVKFSNRSQWLENLRIKQTF